MILPAFMRHFTPISYWTGGTLFYMVLEFIAQNFPDTEESKAYLDILWQAERELLLIGQIQPWFLVMLAQKKGIEECPQS